MKRLVEIFEPRRSGGTTLASERESHVDATKRQRRAFNDSPGQRFRKAVSEIRKHDPSGERMRPRPAAAGASPPENLLGETPNSTREDSPRRICSPEITISQNSTFSLLRLYASLRILCYFLRPRCGLIRRSGQTRDSLAEICHRSQLLVSAVFRTAWIRNSSTDHQLDAKAG